MSLAQDIRERAECLWHLQRVKRLIRDRMQLGPLFLVSVVEVECADPACPGPATQITVLGPDGLRRRIMVHCAPAAVTVADLAGIEGTSA